MAVTNRATISWDCGPKGKAGQGGRASTSGSSLALTSANIAAQDLALTAWSDAASALSNAAAVRQSIEHGGDLVNVAPSAPLSKGEKWVCTMQESSGNRRYFTHTIPAPIEGSGHVVTDTLNADLSNGDWVAYATAAAALLTTPDGNSMAFVRATILTRRR